MQEKFIIHLKNFTIFTIFSERQIKALEILRLQAMRPVTQEQSFEEKFYSCNERTVFHTGDTDLQQIRRKLSRFSPKTTISKMASQNTKASCPITNRVNNNSCPSALLIQ